MEMKSGNKFGWGEWIGGITVVGSLLLVAWEIHQNTVALSAQALLELNEMANEMFRSVSENDQLAAVLVKGDQDLDSLSAVEYRRYHSHAYTTINALDAAYSFYSKGLLSPEDYSGWSHYICPYLKTPSVYSIWNLEKSGFSDNFVLYVDELCNFRKQNDGDREKPPNHVINTDP